MLRGPVWGAVGLSPSVAQAREAGLEAVAAENAGVPAIDVSVTGYASALFIAGHDNS